MNTSPELEPSALEQSALEPSESKQPEQLEPVSKMRRTQSSRFFPIQPELTRVNSPLFALPSELDIPLPTKLNETIPNLKSLSEEIIAMIPEDIDNRTIKAKRYDPTLEFRLAPKKVMTPKQLREKSPLIKELQESDNEIQPLSHLIYTLENVYEVEHTKANREFKASSPFMRKELIIKDLIEHVERIHDGCTMDSPVLRLG